MQLPAIDQNVCGQWTQVDKDYYNSLPYYLVKFTADYRKRWAKWQNSFRTKLRWQPNMGDTMRLAAQEWSPVIRQEAHPSLLSATPTTDINFTRERTMDVNIYRHRFQTREFWFLPEFQDFFNHLEHEYEDLQKQITVYEDAFLRTRVFHHSPFVYVCGVGLVDAPTGIPNAAGTAAKTNAWLAQQFEQDVQPLTAREVFKIGAIVENQLGMTPYNGSGLPKENEGLDIRYKLLMDPEVFMTMTGDSYIQGAKTDSLDLVTKTFKGSLFGMVASDFERYPLRYKYAANTVTIPAPEIVSEAVQSEEKYRTRPNPDYSVNAQYGVAFWMGGESYKPLDVGPPPSMFSKSIEGAVGMNWNGKPRWTKDFLIKCKDGDEAAQYELNTTWGEHMRAQAQLAMGIAPLNAYNVVPILYKRQTGVLP
jgi:hypothetical protein